MQRITNFNPNLNVALANLAPSICVSPEDVVWQEPTNQQYSMGVPIAAANTPPTVGSAPSPVIPDLSISVDQYGNRTYQPMNDFHYSWLFTGYLTNSSNEACFDGNVVIMENRPFGVSQVTAGDGTANVYVPDGETVVEAFFGYSANIQFDTINGTTLTTGYAAGADRTVLLRWFTNQPDPVVKAGDWIADVTYERIADDHAESLVARELLPDRLRQPVQQPRVGQPARPALLLVPGPEGPAGHARPVPHRPSLHGRLCQPVADRADRVHRRRRAGGAQRGPDHAQRRQRDPDHRLHQVGWAPPTGKLLI